jgi:hypothetical protein
MIESTASRVRRVFDALSLLRPYDLANGAKLRLGRSGDGGYVLARQPLPSTLYSFGVGDEVSFEFQLADGGCRGYLFDHTVDGLPREHPNLQFSKEGVGALGAGGGPLAPIADYLRRNGDEHRTDLLLKLDVEGSEYAVMASTPDGTLRSFEQVVLEIHDLRKLAEPEFCEAFFRVFERLNGIFTLCHVHANNCAPLLFVEGFPVADVLELSYVRNDLAERMPSATGYPTFLDCANDPDRPDVNLFFFPFSPVPCNGQGELLQRQSVEFSLAALDYAERLRAEPCLSSHQGKVAVFGRKLTAPGEPAAPRSLESSNRLLANSDRKLNILYLACHETLEYDDVRMFTEMGHRVFSVGGLANPDGPQPATRPTMAGFHSRDWWSAFAGDASNDLTAKRVTREFAQRFDVAVVNHDPALLDTNMGALSGMPIVFRSIGQSNYHREAILARHLDAVHVVRYSQKEVGLPNFCRTDRVIYFAKFLTDYPRWDGGSRAITFHNSFPTRATVSVPTLSQYDEIARSGPFDLYGFWNDGVEAWRGLASADQQLELFRTAGAYVYVYSVPPSYTLSLVEAMLVGVPVVAPSASAVRSILGATADACGFTAARYEVSEFLDHDPSLIWNTANEVPFRVRALLEEPERSQVISQRLRSKASALFDVRKVAPQWQQLLLEITP